MSDAAVSEITPPRRRRRTILLLLLAGLLALSTGLTSIQTASPAAAAPPPTGGDRGRPCVFEGCTVGTTPGGFQYVFVGGKLKKIPTTVTVGGQQNVFVPDCTDPLNCIGPGTFCTLAGQLGGLLVNPAGGGNNGAACQAPPADPGIDIGAVEAQLTNYLRQKALPRPHVKVQPNGNTFTNLPTIFYLPNPATFTLPVNQPVAATITAMPHYRWNFGDGTVGVGDNPGRPYNPNVSPRDNPGYYVSHEYAKPGRFQVTLTVTWQGTFTVAGAPQVFPLGAVVLAANAPVQVQEAAGVLTNYNN